MAVAFTDLRRIAFALPGVTERLSHGRPAFFVRDKLLAHMQEDGEHVALAYPKAKRDALIEAHPDSVSVTPHFKNYDYVLFDLLAGSRDLARTLLVAAWLQKAPKAAVAAWDARVAR